MDLVAQNPHFPYFRNVLSLDVPNIPKNLPLPHKVENLTHVVTQYNQTW